MSNDYDVAHWRPITYEHYVEEVGACFLTADEPEQIETTFEDLEDGRTRIVTVATCCPVGVETDDPPEPVPYLMILWDKEGAVKNICFRRTNWELAL